MTTRAMVRELAQESVAATLATMGSFAMSARRVITK